MVFTTGIVMEAPLQKLRELLGFQNSADNPSEVKYLHSLLESLADESPQKAILTLLSKYLPVVSAQRNLHMRFKLLEQARGEAERSLPELEKAVNDAVLPLPMTASTAALTADNYLKNLAVAYMGIVSGIAIQSQDAALAHLFRQATRRAMQALLRRQLLAYRAYASPSASSWKQLHDLYRAAKNRGLAADGGARSIERIYVSALLLAYADPYASPRNELGTLRATVDGLAPLAEIIDAGQFEDEEGTTAGRFLVNTEEGSPGCPLGRAAEDGLKAGNFVIECRAVVHALDRHLAGENKAGLEVRAPEKMLLNLRNAFGSQASRRFSRVRFRPKADLIAGFDNVLSFVAQGVLRRRQSDGAATAPQPPTSEWALINESPDGFAIRYVQGEKWPVQAGDLVLLRTREDGRIHICLVRRIANLDHKKLELGLQELSPGATIVKLMANGHSAPPAAILLPTLPGFDGNPGLLAKPGCVYDETVVEMLRDGRPTSWRPSGQAESNGNVEFHVLEPL